MPLTAAIVSLVLAQAAAPVPAPRREPLTAEQFSTRWIMLERRTQAEMAVLTGEIRDGLAAYRAEVATAEVGGQPKRGCLPPEGGGAKLNFRELVTAIRALPPAERAKPMREVLFAYLDRTYPCTPKP